MQPPAHIKHVLLYGLNCHSAKQLTYHVLVSYRYVKIVHVGGEEEEEEEGEEEEEEK